MLVADEVAEPLRFVSDRAGRLVFPAPGAILAAEGWVMFVPEELPQGDELQLMLACVEIDSGDEACDRWRAYHGESRAARWAAGEIVGAKMAGQVVDHEALATPDRLRGDEPRLCKMLNKDRGVLRRAALRVSGVDIPEPVAVGVDAGGIDVRARFGVVRVPFEAEARDAEEAERMIGALLGGGP